MYHVCGAPWRPEGVRSLAAGVTGTCELSHMDSGKRTKVLPLQELLTTEPSVQLLFIYFSHNNVTRDSMQKRVFFNGVVTKIK